MPTVTDRRMALVLVSSTGLGRAIALGLGDAGHAVIVHSRGGAQLRETAEASADIVESVAWDLAEPGATKKGIDDLIARGPAPDMLVCNCGGPLKGGIEDLSQEDWAREFQSILMSAIEAVSACLPEMRRRGWGRIVFLSAIAAREPIPELAASSVLRPGLSALARCISRGEAAQGITANVILPGYFDTPRLQQLGSLADGVLASIPAGRWPTSRGG